MKWVPNKQINWDRVKNLLSESQKTGQFTNGGPNVKLLETIIRDKLKIENNKSIICVNNGSSALYALSSGISKTNNKKIKWATQDFTFPPSAQNMLKDTLIIDVDDEGGLDLNLVPNNINGIIVTNIFGTCVNIEKYENWAKENNKYLIFDNAATSFSFYKGKNCCNYGNGSIISFHHTKPLGFGEGGAIICDKKYEYEIRRLINFGIDNSQNDSVWYEEGTNYKMSDIQATFIIQYLDNFEETIETHYKLTKYILEKNIKIYPNFSEKPFLSCLPLIIKDKEQYDKIKKYCDDNGIFNRKYYNPLKGLNKSTKFFNKILCLPLNKDIKRNEYLFLVNFLT